MKRACFTLRGALALVACALAACGGAGTSGESAVETEGASTSPAEGAPRAIVLDDALRERVPIGTTRVVALASGAPVVALGALEVDEHRYAIVDAPAPGRVLRLLAHVGDVVAVGDPLAEIASSDVGALRADLTGATERLHTAEAALTRRRALAADRIASAADVEAAEDALASARADVARSRAGLGAADARGGARTTLIVRTPLPGTVLDHHAFPGESASEDDRLFEIADLSALWLIAHVGEREAALLHDGDPARITFPSRPGVVLELPIALLGRVVDAASRTVEVRVDVPNADQLLRPGEAATVVLLPARSAGRTLAVPAAAVQHTSLGWAVFVPDGPARFATRLVLTGRDLGGDVEILSGVEEGEEVVVEGAFLLRSLADAGDWGEAG